MEQIELTRARADDFNKITQFYRYVTDNTDTMSECCRWIYGLHPSDEMIALYITEGSMYYFEKDGSIICAVSVTPYQGDNYHDVDWDERLEDDEVGSVHILAVNPDFQKQGIAYKTMEAVNELIKSMNKKAIRLDALDTNVPAQKLYESLGFNKIDVKNWYASNLGYADFFVYELKIGV